MQMTTGEHLLRLRAELVKRADELDTDAMQWRGADRAHTAAVAQGVRIAICKVDDALRGLGR